MNVFGNLKLAMVIGCSGIASSAFALEIKPLEDYKEVDRLWMGMEEGVVRPAAYKQVRADSEGYVAVLAKDGQTIEKGEHWATLDPEQLDIERRSFEVDSLKQKQQLAKGREDAQEAQARLGLEMHEIQGKRENLLSASRDPGIPETLRRRAAEAVGALDKRMAVIREKLDPSKIERDLQSLEEDCDLQIARQHKQLHMLEKRSRIVADFNGKLRLSDAVKDKLGTAEEDGLIWVNAGELIGTIVDDRDYELSVSASGPLLGELPRDQLLVFLQDSQTGKLIAAEYSRTDEVDNGREITRNFIFKIRADGVEGARQAQGVLNLVHVYRKFPRPYRLVYKKDIAFLAPDVLETGGWNALVRHLWPDSKVIQVGPQTIAVEPKNAN